MRYVVSHYDELYGLPEETKIKAADAADDAAEVVEMALFSEGGAMEVSTVMLQKW